jgi:hypothetical protein
MPICISRGNARKKNNARAATPNVFEINHKQNAGKNGTSLEELY